MIAPVKLPIETIDADAGVPDEAVDLIADLLLSVVEDENEQADGEAAR